MTGKEQKGSSYVELAYGGTRLGRAASEPYDDEMVTIVVPRRLAEDLYYALAIALGSRAGFGTGFGGGFFADMVYGKKGRLTLGVAPKGKGHADRQDHE
jgi:hypothetical protein